MSKYNIENDPNKHLEASKYKNPIPSRDIILKYLKDIKFPTNIDNIAYALELSKKSQLEGLTSRLNAMVRDRQLKKDKFYFSLPEFKSIFITSKVKADNDGRLKIFCNKQRKDIYINSSYSKMLFVGDEIKAKIIGLNFKGYLEAQIISILKRNTTKITGYYYSEFDSHFLKPINKSINKPITLFPPTEEIEQNAILQAKIVLQPSISSPAVAKIEKVIEDVSPVKEALLIASKKYDLIEQFSNKAIQHLNKIDEKVTLDGRVDLRNLDFVTIDGEDAKDFDDAVYATKTKSGSWKLYVAIADVSNYVRKDSGLDLDVRKRSTSVYFPGYVIPMLPEKLSNELCSIQPNVDRYTLVCEMNVSAKGKLSRYKFYSAVIQSKARLTYTKVANLLENKENTITKETPHLVPSLFALYDLYKILRIARDERGAIDFDTVETQILLNQFNHIESIIPRYRNDAHKLIEECMLMANVAAAKFVLKHKKGAPFRVHGEPKEQRMLALKKYLGSQGIQIYADNKGKITPQSISNILTANKHHKNYDEIQLMTLRSMNQAIYTPDNIGHFGLALKEYAHFTSPIRRYPDLIIHRVIKSIINEYKYGGVEYSPSELATICDNASYQERNADGASKQVENWLKCYFMKQHLGKTFEAKIAHINGLGIFAELKDMYIEGLIHVSKIKGDYYVFDEDKSVLVGRRTNRIFKINQKILVKVIKADTDNIYIDFELVNNNGNNEIIHTDSTKENENSNKKKKRRRKRRNNYKKGFIKKKKVKNNDNTK